MLIAHYEIQSFGNRLEMNGEVGVYHVVSNVTVNDQLLESLLVKWFQELT